MLAVAGLAAAIQPSPAPAAPQSGGRVIVLGFDGADADTTAQMMAEGQLPNLERLSQQGSFAGLRSTAPPESPVAWAALNSGQNPAKTAVPGFVRNTVGDPVLGPDGEPELDEDGQPKKKGTPGFNFGHIVKEERPLAEFDAVPLPLWSPAVLGSACFAVVFLVFMLVFGLLLRMSTAPAVLLSLILGGAGGWAGYVWRGFLPGEIPIWENPTATEGFWQHAARAGVETRVLDAAMSFNQPAEDGARVLAGLGLPDARSGLGDWFIYTDNQLEFDRPPKGYSKGLTAGTIFRVDFRDERLETQVFGPVNFWQDERTRAELEKIDQELKGENLGYKESLDLQTRKRELEDLLGERATADLVVERDSAAGVARVRIGTEEQELREGEWSDWYRITFDLNPLLKVQAVTRVKLVHLSDPHFELFVNTLDLDPAEPVFWQPVSAPIDFSQELAEDCGTFETYGWPSLTMPFKDGRISVETMLEDLEFTMKWREDVFGKVLEKDDWRLFFGVYSITDRVQHMMYQYYDVEHPLYVAEEANKEVSFFGETIKRSEVVPHVYRQMDRIVGEVMEKLRPDDTLILCSDHGFESFRYQVQLNNWLESNGFLTLKEGITSKDAGRSLSGYADWSKTRAYSLGLGFIYLNLEGRENEGIVKPSEARGVLEEIRDALLATTDPMRGNASVVDEVYITADVHDGPYLDKEADLLVGFAPGYRVAWSTSGGSLDFAKDGDGGVVPAPIYKDNDSPWSGGHVSVSLEAVKGIFFCNRPVELPPDGPDLLHVAPTVLDLVGVPVPPEMDLPALKVAQS